jgi:formylglycine-generating enzyme required for sulfatase activity
MLLLRTLTAITQDEGTTNMEITNSIGMKLVLIPAGEFLMGAPESDMAAPADEKPQHLVRITRPFYLGVCQVTQGQYRAVADTNPASFEGSDDLPVESVSWNDAVAFCNRLSALEGLEPYYDGKGGTRPGADGYRLPTEAEWEYAARAGSTTRFSFGPDDATVGEYAWFIDNSAARTHPVGQKQPNAFGLHDMHGNVWEWCCDGFDPLYYGRSPAADPHCSADAPLRVHRGGCWADGPWYLRSTDRGGSAADSQDDEVGFRVARGYRA